MAKSRFIKELESVIFEDSKAFVEKLNSEVDEASKYIAEKVPDRLYSTERMPNQKYEYTEEEKTKMYKALAAENIGYQELEDDKKSVMSDFTAKMNLARAKINDIARKLNAGFEYKDMNFVVFYHFPSENKKLLFNTETQKYSRVEDMTNADLTLWRQFEISEEGTDVKANT